MMPRPEAEITKRRRKGQSLAEFAITLPILLILVFGIIEFGRIFQAWVTLQNSARDAARYATTGAYNAERYIIDDSGVDDPRGSTVIPCINNNDQRGGASADASGVLVYDGIEGLFATWYDGTDCQPNNPVHQDMRKDMLRILSIMERARVGAAGLALGGTNWIENSGAEAGARAALFDVWYRPLNSNRSRAGSDQPGWFDVMVCSSRAFLNPDSTPLEPKFSGINARFVTVLDRGGSPDDDRAPVCVLNENPPGDAGGVNNSDHPWLDPGGAGDTVTIVVSFNHPLVTPLGLAPYIPLQARRSAVNEAFRVADATRALLPTGNTGIVLPQPPTARIRLNNDDGDDKVYTLPQGSTVDTRQNVELDASLSTDPDGNIVAWSWRINNIEIPGGTTEVFTAQLVPGIYPITLVVTDDQGLSHDVTITIEIRLPEPPIPDTDTHTPTPSITPIPPFQCELLTITDLSFFGNRVYISINNANIEETTLTRALLGWRVLPDYPNMFVSSFALDGSMHWNGRDTQPDTDTNADVPTPADLFLNAERTIFGESTHTWEGVIASGPSSLQNSMTIYDFARTTFTFDNPANPNDPCVRPLDIPTPTPSPTFWANQPTNTATWTPDCASVLIDVRFVEFRTFGVVVLSVTNRRSNVAVFTDFQINWIQRAPGVMTLERITVGGSGPADSMTPTIPVWQSGSASQDSTPPTNGGSTRTPREGTWLQNYTFPPNSITPMYLDFGGTTTTLPAAFGVSPADFNGTWFEIGCGTAGGGGGGGGGGGSSGRINLFNQNTPVPTNTPGPTQPPPPTFTPSRTWTPGPPTNTRPPPTRTNTPRPSNTPLPTQPPTFPPPPTVPGSGGSDGDN